ncbi:hypothetical protein BH20ACT9_BH20ACT9_04070 [soil metagenome]
MRWVPAGADQGVDVTTRPARLRGACGVRSVLVARAAARGRRMRVHVRSRGDAATMRATVVAGRSLGPAVARNRARRRLRAALVAVEPPPGLDVVVVAGQGARTADFDDLVHELRLLLQRAVARAERST